MKDSVIFRNNLNRFLIKYDLEYLVDLSHYYVDIPKEVCIKEFCYATDLKDLNYKLNSIYRNRALVKNLEVISCRPVVAC